VIPYGKQHPVVLLWGLPLRAFHGFNPFTFNFSIFVFYLRHFDKNCQIFFVIIVNMTKIICILADTIFVNYTDIGQVVG